MTGTTLLLKGAIDFDKKREKKLSSYSLMLDNKWMLVIVVKDNL